MVFYYQGKRSSKLTSGLEFEDPRETDVPWWCDQHVNYGPSFNDELLKAVPGTSRSRSGDINSKAKPISGLRDFLRRQT